MPTFVNVGPENIADIVNGYLEENKPNWADAARKYTQYISALYFFTPGRLKKKAFTDKCTFSFANRANGTARWSKLFDTITPSRSDLSVQGEVNWAMSDVHYAVDARDANSEATIRSATALASAVRAMQNEKTARTIENELFSHPWFEEATQDRLHLTDEDSSLNKQEELIMSRWAKRIPGIRAFERAGRVFMNKLRFDLYVAMRKAATKSGTATEEERRQIAMFINESTGRGGLGKLEPAAVPLARTMFSPRYLASRVQLLAGHSLWGGTARSRKLIAQEYARSMIGLGLYYTLLSMLFADEKDKKRGSVSLDARSSDFGKIRVGDSRLDPMAGLAQVITLFGRTVTGESKGINGKVTPLRGPKVANRDWWDTFTNFARSKLHPVPAKIVNLLSSRSMTGEPADVQSELSNAATPITYADIYEAFQEHGLDEATALSLLAFFGEGLQNYKDK